MGIKNTQRRVTIIMNKTDYELVEQAAKKDRRSVSSYCNNIIMCNIENNNPKIISTGNNSKNKKRNIECPQID